MSIFCQKQMIPHQMWCQILHGYRSSRPEVFCKKDVLENFANLTGKHLCQIKKRLWNRCFPVSFVKFSRLSFIMEHFRWLLLWVEHCLGKSEKHVTQRKQLSDLATQLNQLTITSNQKMVHADANDRKELKQDHLWPSKQTKRKSAISMKRNKEKFNW